MPIVDLKILKIQSQIEEAFKNFNEGVMREVECLNLSEYNKKFFFENTLKLEEAYSNLKTALEGNNDIGVVTEIDHSQNATSVDLELPTYASYFLRKS